ncbi:hypothetical protein [Streptomyces sp. NPDC004065]|uniref:hypothetical protein n=1 Tax=Streptomyces sp. NPDC004065 TaxID=3364689 RepID=UPI00384D6CCF
MLAHWRGGKVVLLFLLVLGVFCGGGWMFLNKGLYLLPDRMCEDTLDRDTVKQVLPNVRSADSSANTQGAGDGLTFWCRVTTSSDSSLSGEARVRQVSRGQWLEYYRGAGERSRVVRVSVEGVEALARIDSGETTSAVYVPCTPPAVPEYNASRPYAVAAEARVYGPARAAGVPLRQALTDFAYRLARHAYHVAECEKRRELPRELPRYKER